MMNLRLTEILVRPYVRHELPGWGRVYSKFVGGYERDDNWAGAGKRVIKGKLHGFEMELDLGKWSQRWSYFLARYYDLGSQLVLMKALRSGDRIYDVGANIGMLCILASKLVGPRGRVDAVEPNPNCRAYIHDLLSRNAIRNVEVHGAGLADEESVLTLSVPRINHGEATLARSQYADDEIDKVEVPVMRGDDLLGDGPPPALIKIDVEGFECRAIDGLTKTLSAHIPLVLTEVVTAHLERAGFTPQDLFDRLTSLGYQGFRVGLGRGGLLGHELLLTPVPLETFEGSADVLWMHPDNPRSHAFEVSD